MRNYFKYLVYLYVFACFSFAQAGSYEDFFAAIKKDDAAVITELLQRGFDPNTPGPDGQDGLYLALRDGSLKAANALVDWPKTKVESRNARDESPLMMAALKGHLDVVKKLIDRDADVNKPGWAPLHYAATGGHLAVMELLLEAGADTAMKNQLGMTAIDFARRGNRPDSVEMISAHIRGQQPKGKW